MKKLIKTAVIFILMLFTSCNEDTSVDRQESSDLQDSVGVLNLISSDNKQLNIFLKSSNINKQELRLDEVRLLKFEGDEGKYAFAIPMDVPSKQFSKTLFAYFIDSDFTKFKAIIHSVETTIDKNNVERQIISVSNYDKAWTVKEEFIDGRSSSNTKSGDNCSPPPPPPFQQVDTDWDGGISKEEAKAVPNLLGRWDTYDSNTDGKLDEAEYAKFGENVNSFMSCVLCRLKQLNCDHTDTPCLIYVYAECGLKRI